jgi:hypothetical protein
VSLLSHRAAVQPDHEQPLDRWHRWRRDHPVLRAGFLMRPAPLDPDTLRALAASIVLDRDHRRALRALIVDLLRGER